MNVANLTRHAYALRIDSVFTGMVYLFHKDGEIPRREGKKMTHKFQVKKTELGYTTCCGTSIIKITKSQDPEMFGSVNWYFQDENQFADDSAFYSFAEIKSYLMRRDHHDQYVVKLMADVDATLAVGKAARAKVGA